MTLYGGPEHVLQDDYGNKRVNLPVEVFANEADAQAQNNPLATVPSNSEGLWPVDVPADEVWMRIPGAPGSPPTIRHLRGLAQAADLTALAARVSDLESTDSDLDGGIL